MFGKIAAGFLLMGLAGCSPTSDPMPEAAPDPEALAPRAQRYLLGGGQIPEDVEVTVQNLTAFETTGLYRGDLMLAKEGQSQRVSFYVTADGRWLFLNDPIDLNVDPVATSLAGISISPEDPSLGSPGAAVTIVEYSDFQCPFCARADSIVQGEVLSRYGDQVRFVYKQMPLVSLHPWAQSASEMGLCVLSESGQEAYWRFHAEVFANQRTMSPDPQSAVAEIEAMAIAAGAKPKALRDCMASGRAAQVVADTVAEANALGINATPTFFINGRKLSGAQPLEVFAGMIDSELAR